MILNATTKLLRADMAADANDTEAQLVVTYEDYDQNEKMVARGQTETATTGDDAVTVLAAPAADIVRKITGITIYNADDAASTIFLEIYDGTTAWKVFSVIFATLEWATWTPTTGWQVFTTLGEKKILTNEAA